MSRVSATPITNAMEMYNWLHSRKNILSCSSVNENDLIYLVKFELHFREQLLWNSIGKFQI